MNNKIFKINDNIAIKKIPDGALAINKKTIEIFEYNKTSYDILNLINGKKKVSQIIKELSNKYKCKEKEIQNNIINFLESQIKEKIIKEVK